MALFYPNLTRPQLGNLYCPWHDSLVRPLYDLGANKYKPLHTNTHTHIHTYTHAIHVGYTTHITQYIHK
jgi:hypothetical protein